MNAWTEDEVRLWRESLRALRGDFRRVRTEKVGVLLVEGDESGEVPLDVKDSYPLLFRRYALDGRGRTYYRRSGTRRDEKRLEPLAADAGRLLRDAPPEVIAQIGRKTHEAMPSDDAQAWVGIVYSLAWRKHKGTALTASPKTLWNCNGKSSVEVPLDNVPAWQQDEHMPPKVREALAANDPPRRWYSRLDDLAGASVAACDLLLHATAPPAADPVGGWVFSGELDWPEEYVATAKRSRFLNDHKAEIPNESRGRKRYVDANAFVRYWAKQRKAAFESLDDTDGKPIVPVTIPTQQIIEGMTALYEKANARKRRK